MPQSVARQVVPTGAPTADAPAVTGRRIVVVASGGPGAEIASLLASAGAQVALVDAGAPSDVPTLGKKVVVRAKLRTPEAAASAIDDASTALGGVDQFVHAHLPTALCRPAPFATVQEAQWARDCQGTLDAAWWLVRAVVHPMRAAGGGSVVFVVPTVGLSGASGYVMLSTVAEGLRVLAKSCGRCWGTSGIIVTTVATSPALWVSPEEACRLQREISLSEPANGGPGSAADLAALVATLGAGTTRAYTAGTLVADGGLWMGL